MIMFPTTWDNISYQFESLQDGLDIYGSIEEIRHLAEYIDLLLKMFTPMQHMEDLTSKGMASDTQ